MIYWHYTTGSRMSFILTGPALLPLAPARRLKFEKRPILWFTEARHPGIWQRLLWQRTRTHLRGAAAIRSPEVHPVEDARQR